MISISVHTGAAATELLKAAEGRRTPGREARSATDEFREASWSAPALWRFRMGGGTALPSNNNRTKHVKNRNP